MPKTTLARFFIHSADTILFRIEPDVRFSYFSVLTKAAPNAKNTFPSTDVQLQTFFSLKPNDVLQHAVLLSLWYSVLRWTCPVATEERQGGINAHLFQKHLT